MRILFTISVLTVSIQSFFSFFLVSSQHNSMDNYNAVIISARFMMCVGIVMVIVLLMALTEFTTCALNGICPSMSSRFSFCQCRYILVRLAHIRKNKHNEKDDDDLGGRFAYLGNIINSSVSESEARILKGMRQLEKEIKDQKRIDVVLNSSSCTSLLGFTC